ncbi:hypothetical protein B0H14DRAFT_3131087 [Mycena olivaceomarginata]|nr:hypothetical protein B0H14DRAFT_2771240 [Mycena olivaceomarginata]KAJ7868766.1 hypothetical protein B0H14DRAFT_3132554 [Mycena olivaceomarginata]KAJ7874208.1 hypothetical protein B0H14DRAFT_3131087 [Mycena olivaceomarginata]
MSQSARKDNVHVMIVHKVPPHLTKHEFERKLEALLDEVALLLVVQKNVLKVEMIFQDDGVDEHVKAFGFPPREPVVFVAIHCETADHFLAMLAAPEFRQAFEKGKEFGLQTYSSGFSAEVVAKIDDPAPQDAAHLVCVYNVPPHISSLQHDQKFEDFINNFISVPAVQKNFIRFEMWQPNNMLDDHIRAFGYSEATPTFIHHARLGNWDSVEEMMTDAAAQQNVLDAGDDGKHFNLKTDGYVFHARLVTKIDNS